MTNTKTMPTYSGDFQRIFPVIFSGQIRSTNEDFVVTEIPSVEPVGTGEHVWLKIRKSGENTDWVAGQLARIAGVKRRDVSYAGMKDRNAITTQWFSVYLPGKTAPNWQEHLPDSVELLEEARHERKLRLGTLKGNHFQITVRQCEYKNGGNAKQLEARIATLRELGIPNYFGEQRFGRSFNNVYKAEAWFTGEFTPKKRNLQGLYLSSARSWIFNQILSKRVAMQTWNQAVDGDVFMLEGSRSWFAEALSSDISDRVENKELHPTGALWGKGELATSEDILTIEEGIAEENSTLSQGLINHKLKQERRSLRLLINDLNYEWLDKSDIRISFSLPSGTYATSALRELVDFYSK